MGVLRSPLWLGHLNQLLACRSCLHGNDKQVADSLLDSHFRWNDEKRNVLTNVIIPIRVNAVPTFLYITKYLNASAT